MSLDDRNFPDRRKSPEDIDKGNVPDNQTAIAQLAVATGRNDVLRGPCNGQKRQTKVTDQSIGLKW